MPAHKITTQISTSPACNCLQTMGVGDSIHSKGTNVISGKPVHLSSPGLLLKMAVCNSNAWSESRLDSQDLAGPPERLHSDQDKNFESLLGDLCKALKVTKSHTTPYHPQGDGLVERMNWSLLNLLCTFEGDEQNLQLLLYIYRTTKHVSTGLSPHEILFGHNPPSIHIPNFRATAILDLNTCKENCWS